MVTYKKLTDAELILLYQSGDVRGFETLLNRHKSKVYSSIYYLVKDKYAAEDIMQDVFIKVVDCIQSGKYTDNGRFQPWLHRIAHNMAIDKLRKNKKMPRITLEDGKDILETLDFTSSYNESVMLSKDSKQYIRDRIKKLPHAQRQVMLLRMLAKMSFQEIADFTGVSINTALGRMRYGVMALKTHIKPENIKAYDQTFY